MSDTPAEGPILPTYYVQHPDGSYSVADPQPTQAAPAPSEAPDLGPLEEQLRRAYYYTDTGEWRGAGGEWDRWHAVAKVATAQGATPAPVGLTDAEIVVRTPLSRDRIAALDAGCGHATLHWDTRVSLVRAVERAHGIPAPRTEGGE